MSQRKIAVIAGASGLVGGELLNLLLQNSEYERVISLGRRKLDVQHSKLEQIITDFSDIKKYEFWTEADVVFCCVGTTIKKAGSKENFRKVDVGIPKSLMDAAQLSSIQFHLISSIGANSDSKNFYLKTKGEVEDLLKISGIGEVHIYRPSILLGVRKEQRLGEKLGIVLNSLFSWLLIGKLKKYRGISASHLAQKMMFISLESQANGVYIHENDELID